MAASSLSESELERYEQEEAELAAWHDSPAAREALERAVEDEVALYIDPDEDPDGYEAACENVLFNARVTGADYDSSGEIVPSGVRFGVSPEDALEAIHRDVDLEKEVIPIRAPVIALRCRVGRPRMQRSRRSGRRAVVAARGDPSRPRPSDRPRLAAARRRA